MLCKERAKREAARTRDEPVKRSRSCPALDQSDEIRRLGITRPAKTELEFRKLADLKMMKMV